MPARKPPRATRPRSQRAATAPRSIAVIGAGMAGVACARTLMQAGHQVTVFEKTDHAGGRTTTLQTPFGGFDAGAQYFTVRDERFTQALATVPGMCRPWSANTVRVLDAAGRVIAANPLPNDPHWVARPGMGTLVDAWALPLQQAGCLHTGTHVLRIEPDRLAPSAGSCAPSPPKAGNMCLPASMQCFWRCPLHPPRPCSTTAVWAPAWPPPWPA